MGKRKPQKWCYTFKKILLKYNNRTKEISADSLLNYFKKRKYLEYKNNILKPVNTSDKKFNAELIGTENLIKALKLLAE